MKKAAILAVIVFVAAIYYTSAFDTKLSAVVSLTAGIVTFVIIFNELNPEVRQKRKEKRLIHEEEYERERARLQARRDMGYDDEDDRDTSWIADRFDARKSVFYKPLRDYGRSFNKNLMRQAGKRR
ncbi:hypothetical protein HY484_03815 [Candidatus Woesearchaeota archaeon]|nr:hypothetical protein [Candidatus Woesearchaeota archaeon]